MPIIGICDEDKRLHIYSPVPGLEPSKHYSFKIRSQGSSEWKEMFAFVTTCKSGGTLTELQQMLIIGDLINGVIHMLILKC